MAFKALEDAIYALRKRINSVEGRLALLDGRGVPAGTVIAFAGPNAPRGWLVCDGAAVSRKTYSALFSALSTLHGAGDGSTTFNLPDLRGRVTVGRDASQGEFNTFGETGGEKTHTLKSPEMPQTPIRPMSESVSRVRLTNGTFDLGDPGTYNIVIGGASGENLIVGGGGEPHNNLQPYIVLSYIIKT